MSLLRTPTLALSLALVLTGLGASGAARANAALTVCLQDGACGTVEPVRDDAMADVAGKFTIAGEVVGMNLLMNSTWQSAGGQKLNGSAGVMFSLPGAGRAGHFSTQASATGTDTTAADAEVGAPIGTVSGGAGLSSVSGVSQAVQVAGDRNAARNGATVQVTTGNLGAHAGNGLTSATYQAANGAQVQVDIAGNSVQMLLRAPEGLAQQSINSSGSGSIRQNIQIAASRQTVINQLQLEVQVRHVTNQALASQGLLQSLNALRGR